jgi:hypothetical protein
MSNVLAIQPEQKAPVIKQANLDLILNHPVNKSFINSIQRRGPRKQIRIITVLQPLHTQILGITHYIDKDTYIIGLNSQYSTRVLQEVMTHELVHVKQFSTGALITINKISYWNGCRIDWSTPHDERAWEIQADRIQYRLWILWRINQTKK